MPDYLLGAQRLQVQSGCAGVRAVTRSAVPVQEAAVGGTRSGFGTGEKRLEPTHEQGSGRQSRRDQCPAMHRTETAHILAGARVLPATGSRFASADAAGKSVRCPAPTAPRGFATPAEIRRQPAGPRSARGRSGCRTSSVADASLQIRASTGISPGTRTRWSSAGSGRIAPPGTAAPPRVEGSPVPRSRRGARPRTGAAPQSALLRSAETT